jgi:hypothetical protein
MGDELLNSVVNLSTVTFYGQGKFDCNAARFSANPRQPNSRTFAARMSFAPQKRLAD